MGSSISMKVHQFARGFWEHEPSLTLGCKRLRPLAPKLANSVDTVASFDLKSFIRPESGPRKLGSSDDHKRDSPQVRVHLSLSLSLCLYIYIYIYIYIYSFSILIPTLLMHLNLIT